MNDKPVAWAYKSINVDGKEYLSEVSLKPLFGLVTRYGQKEVPLYTRPSKQLSDEDLYRVLEKYQGIELCRAIIKEMNK